MIPTQTMQGAPKGFGKIKNLADIFRPLSSEQGERDRYQLLLKHPKQPHVGFCRVVTVSIHARITYK